MELSELGELGKYIIASSIKAGITEDSPEDILFWCEINNEKYTDRDFPGSFSSLSQSEPTSSKLQNWSKYEWHRASSLFESVEIFKDEVSPLDIVQGALGDYNFLCALSCLSEIPGYIQSLFLTKAQNAFGFYAVNICKDGRWVSIMLDDFFPCGQSRKIPCFSQSIGGELWVMILEKAWAKCCGSFENTELTSLSQCLRDLTGAPTRVLPCKESLWEELVSCKTKRYIMCASASETKSSHRLLEAMGLIGSLSYAVLRTADVGERILQLRNPWSKIEWNGDWSDSSDKWTTKLKKKLDYEAKADGTFWMSFADFIEYFSFLTICELNPNYSYSSQLSEHDKESYSVFSLEVTSSGEYDISIDQKDKVHQNTYCKYEYSEARVVLCKETRSGLEYVIGYRGCERNLSRKLTLRKGKYFLFVMIDWAFDEREFVASVYGLQWVEIENLGRVEGFLDRVYRLRAEVYAACVDYSAYGIENCFRYYEMLPEGFGYFYIKNNNTKAAITEKTYFKRFKNLSLLPPHSGTSYTVTVKSTSDTMVLLKVIANEKYLIDPSSTYSISKNEDILIVN